MEELTKSLCDKQEYYETLQKECNSFLKSAPEGTLRVSTYKNNVFYYQSKDIKDKKWKYISKNNMQLIRDLAQKEYCSNMLKVVTPRLRQLDQLMQKYQSGEIQEVYQNLHPAKQRLVLPYEIPFEEYAAQWEKLEYPKRRFADDAAEIYTEKGERVLSKSEKIIADKLYLMGIHYRYEYPLEINHQYTLHPDFTLLHPESREEWYWEHMGMMDDLEYSEKALHKLEIYAREGLYPGKKLIFTYETKLHPLNMRSVIDMLKAYGFAK